MTFRVKGYRAEMLVNAGDIRAVLAWVARFFPSLAVFRVREATMADRKRLMPCYDASEAPGKGFHVFGE